MRLALPAPTALLHPAALVPLASPFLRPAVSAVADPATSASTQSAHLVPLLALNALMLALALHALLETSFKEQLVKQPAIQDTTTIMVLVHNVLLAALHVHKPKVP